MKCLMFFFPVLLLFVLFSCSTNELETADYMKSDVIGVWADTTLTQPAGKKVVVLNFATTGTFVERTEYYGLFSGQLDSDISYWTEDAGNYIASAGKLFIVSRQETSWTSQGLTSDIKSTTRDSVLYENCSYLVSQDSLKLEFTTYPANLTVKTYRNFKKMRYEL